jgi:hypothetical protein
MLKIDKNKNIYENLSKFNIKINIIFFSKIIFILSLVIILFLNIKYSNQPILEQHSFRQTQTAITSYYLEKDGFRFDYETPVVGEPWSIPFEFPLYQEIVALTAKFTALPLTQAGRLWGLIFTVLTCIPLYSILKKLNIKVSAIYLCLALFLSSPLYLFWSGTFMIEGAALFFTIYFLYFSLLIILREWKNINFFTLSCFLLLGLLQKVTTSLPVLLFFIIILTLFSIRPVDFQNNKLSVLKILLAIVIPLFIAYSWVMYSDLIKVNNLIGMEFTSDNLRGWNYGNFDQILSQSFWIDMVYERNIKQN